MIGGFLDRAIAAVAPGYALRRSAARTRMALMATYAAAQRNRFTRDERLTTASADRGIEGDRTTMLARARAVGRDTFQGASLRRSFERNVVRCGITPTFAPKDPDGEPDEDFATAISDLWRRWATNPRACEVERKRSFYRMQGLAVGELVEAGEHFVVMGYRSRDRLPGLVLQAFEPEQLDLSVDRNPRSGNEIRSGIEINADGAMVALHLRPRHDDALARGAFETIQVPASRVLHIFDPTRVRQSHGITRFHAVLNRIAATNRYEDAMLMSAIMEACIGLIAKPEAGGDDAYPGLKTPSGEDGLDADGNREVEFQPGMVAFGEYEPFVPSRPGSEHDKYMTRQTRAIGAGSGSSYEQVARDFSQGSYSSQRQGMLEDRAEYECVQQILVEQLCQPVVREFIRVCVADGLVRAPRGWDVDREGYYSVEWQGPPRHWIDPDKESKAAERNLALGIDTHVRILNEKGYGLEETFAQIAEAKAMAEKYGLSIAGLNAPVPGSPSAGDSQDDSAARAGAGLRLIGVETA